MLYYSEVANHSDCLKHQDILILNVRCFRSNNKESSNYTICRIQLILLVDSIYTRPPSYIIHPKWVEKTRDSEVFLTNFEVFGYLMKHSFECSIELLKAFIIIREIQSKSSPNFMITRVTYSTSFTVVISFVLSSWVINEFEKVYSRCLTECPSEPQLENSHDSPFGEVSKWRNIVRKSLQSTGIGGKMRLHNAK